VLTDCSQAALFFNLSFQFSILHLLIYICLYTVPQYKNSKSLSSHLINTFPLPRWIPLSLTVPRPYFLFPDRFFCCDRLLACCPTPNLEGQSTVFKTPRVGWPSYTLRHWVTILVIFYDLHGQQWDYSFPQALHREKYIKYQAQSHMDFAPRQFQL